MVVGWKALRLGLGLKGLAMPVERLQPGLHDPLDRENAGMETYTLPRMPSERPLRLAVLEPRRKTECFGLGKNVCMKKRYE